jgi:hypothetical protein
LREKARARERRRSAAGLASGSADTSSTATRGHAAVTRRAASMPSMSGIRTSMITMSGSETRTSSTASAPEPASPAHVKPAVASTTSRAAARKGGWSSTASTRTSSAERSVADIGLSGSIRASTAGIHPAHPPGRGSTHHEPSACAPACRAATAAATLHHMSDITGPVQILAVGFREGARFEGRIAEQIDQLEQSNTIRVLDFVFLHRDEATKALVRMDYDGPDREGRVTMLLQGAEANGDTGPTDGPAAAFRLSPDDIREVADALDPGTSAGFIIFEHVWARGLKQAIAETDGVPFAEGFLTPEAVAAIAG